MKTVQLPIKLPELQDAHPEYLQRPVPPHCFPLHLLSAVIGGRGSGKSSFALKLIKLYDKYKSFDRIIVFSTTAHKDPKVKAFLESKTFAELTHYKAFSNEDLQNEMNRMESDLSDWRAHTAKLAVWMKYVANGYDVDKMEYDEICLLDELDFEKPKPPNKSGMYPCHLILFDDLVACRVFNANMSGLGNNLLISHRHYSCSVMILSQTFQCFLPKQIRANNIGLWILFGTKCEKTMWEIADDVAAKVTPQEFVKAWKFATSKPYTAFICDYDTQDDKMRFRMGLDKVIIMDGDNVEAEKLEAPKK